MKKVPLLVLAVSLLFTCGIRLEAAAIMEQVNTETEEPGLAEAASESLDLSGGELAIEEISGMEAPDVQGPFAGEGHKQEDAGQAGSDGILPDTPEIILPVDGDGMEDPEPSSAETEAAAEELSEAGPQAEDTPEDLFGVDAASDNGPEYAGTINVNTEYTDRLTDNKDENWYRFSKRQIIGVL